MEYIKNNKNIIKDVQEEKERIISKRNDKDLEGKNRVNGLSVDSLYLYKKKMYEKYLRENSYLNRFKEDF